MTILILGVAAAFNLLIILYKLDKGKQLNAAIDAALLFILNYMFAGTLTGATIATVASAIVSFVLLFYTPSIIGEEEV